MKPIGIDIPIKRGEQGFFKQTYTTSEAIKTNIKNLLMTSKGERPINPSFGNSLDTLVFEQDEEITKEVIRDKIENIINEYMPSVIINDIIFDDGVIDSNTVEFSIKFRLKQYPNFTDIVDIKF